MYIRSSLYIALFSLMSPLIAQVDQLSTVKEYDTKFTSDTPMITMYSMTACGPCRATKPHFISLAARNADINFCMVDTENEEFDTMLNNLGIQSVPYFIFSYKGQKVIETSGGLGFATLENYIKDFRSGVDKLKAKNTPKKSGKKESAKKAPEKKDATPKPSQKTNKKK